MTSAPGIEQFVFVITSRRFAESLDFYRDVLGLALVEEWHEHGHGGVLSAGGPARVELIDAPDAEVPTTSDSIFIGLQVDDIEPVHQRAVAAGHEIVREPADRPWGGRGFVVRDPNGVAINVYTAYDGGRGPTD